MLHLTSWEKEGLIINQEYATPEVSNYWNQKIESDIADIGPVEANFAPFPSEIRNSIIEIIKSGKYASELLKEYIFEEVRQKDFPNLPSRKNCMFALPDNVNIEEVRARFGMSDQIHKTLLRIEGVPENHTVTRVDANFLNCNLSKQPQIKEYATKYWSGEEMENPLTELLLVGRYKILEILN